MKKYIYNSDRASGKRGQNMYWVKKKTCLGVLE